MRKAAHAATIERKAALSAVVSGPPHALSALNSGRPPLRILLALITAALALHWFFIDGLSGGAAVRQPVLAPVLEVRSIARALPSAPLNAPLSTSPSATPSGAVQRPTSKAAPQTSRALANEQSAPLQTPDSVSVATAPVELVPAAVARAASAPASAPAMATAAASAIEPASAPASAASTATATATATATVAPPLVVSPAAGDVPTYRTLLPPSLRLQYAVRRGALSGNGELLWRHGDTGYNLSLTARLAGLSLLTQVSQGQIDSAGLAPLRFTDQRLRGGVSAANFQRLDSQGMGKITFSGPSTEYPLVPGAQDRLSWMVQLAAIASAEPERLAPGGKVILYVVSARGDADAWVFRFVDFEMLTTADGPVRAAKFSRDARRLYDTQVDAWLDPARHHLPIKARLGTSPDGEPLELVLQSLEAL